MQAGLSLKVVAQCAAGKNLSDKVLSGALVSDADFSNATMNNVGAAGATAWECIAVLKDPSQSRSWWPCVPPAFTAANLSCWRAGDSN